MKGFYLNKTMKISNEEPDNSVYSDRLFQWDSNKHDKLCEKYFGNTGQYWSGREPKKIEAFLIEYLGIELKLVEIIQDENQSSGYPYWCFRFKTLKSRDNR